MKSGSADLWAPDPMPVRQAVQSDSACSSAPLGLLAYAASMMGSHVALSFAAASSFGGGSGLFGLPTLQVRPDPKSPQTRPITCLTRSTAWAAIAALVLAFFLFRIGPGLDYSNLVSRTAVTAKPTPNVTIPSAAKTPASPLLKAPLVLHPQQLHPLI